MVMPIVLAVVSVVLLLIAAQSTSIVSNRAHIASHRAVPPAHRRWRGSMPVPNMQVIVSILVLAAGLYVILNQSYGVDDKRWGYGIVGTIVGYWLRSTGK